jgi:hypothetical protein
MNTVPDTMRNFFVENEASCWRSQGFYRMNNERQQKETKEQRAKYE